MFDFREINFTEIRLFDERSEVFCKALLYKKLALLSPQKVCGLNRCFPQSIGLKPFWGAEEKNAKRKI